MNEQTKRFGRLEKMELISAIVYLSVGKVLHTFVGTGIATLTLCILMCVFTILLLVFMKYHVYRYDKPLLTVFSIYYKSLVYVVVIFSMTNFPGNDILTGTAMISTLIYMLLSYINGKQYYQILNAYLYLSMASVARVGLFLHVA